MDFEDDNNSREELYKRFKQALKQPPGERYFDEDELVEVFDYAGDLGDDYVRTEALLCGARLYPDSQMLADRRALLYLDVDDSDTMASAYLQDNRERSTLLADIVRLEIEQPDADAAAPALEFLLSQYDSFGDEEIIRFVDLAIDLDQYNWLIDNLDTLRTKVNYLPSMLYEVLNEADNRDDTATCVSIAEELVELEPFTSTYWSTLFRAHARAGHEDEARNAFDYAKALAADNPDTLIWLCETALHFAPFIRSEATEVLDGLIATYPDNFAYVDLRCGFYSQEGRLPEAIRAVSAYNDAHPAELPALRQLLACNIDDARERVARYFDTNKAGIGADDLNDIVNNLMMSGASRSLNGLLAAVSKYQAIEATHLIAWIESLYALERFEEVTMMIDHMSNYEPIIDVPLKGATVCAATVISYMKLGRGDAAEAFIAKTRPSFESVLDCAPMAIRMIVRLLLNIYDNVGHHPADDRMFWQYYDPLRYSKF